VVFQGENDGIAREVHIRQENVIYHYIGNGDHNEQHFRCNREESSSFLSYPIRFGAILTNKSFVRETRDCSFFLDQELIDRDQFIVEFKANQMQGHLAQYCAFHASK
jgi:hypothetical protein